jgi:TonB family protein
MIIKQSRSVLRAIRKAQVLPSYPVKLIRTAEYVSSFSFFSYVFVNPSVTDVETKEIVNHEMVHIRQRHWIDLVLVELLCLLQWFNPLVWIYIRFIRQNHEYLADEVALQRTSDPVIYKAALLNQIVGSPVVSLANSFNYSLNKKRFNMMKNIVTSPYRKMKILLILPVFAIVLYSFAVPDYKYLPADGNSSNSQTVSALQLKEVKGTVVQADGESLPGATVTVKGTTIGTSADSKGFFKLDNVSDDGMLVVSFVGFKTKVIRPVFTSEMTIQMIRDTVKYLNSNISVPPPPPPPPDRISGKSSKSLPEVPPPPPPPPPPANASKVKIRNSDGSEAKPLIVIDGVVNEKAAVGDINPDMISSMNVLKDEAAAGKYGEKGKNGVIEITTKDGITTKADMSDVKVTGYANDQKKDDATFVVVEEMPQFPGGGENAMVAWIVSHLKYPAEALKNKITGKVLVDFMVSSNGKVKNVVVNKPVDPLLDAEAIRVISSMPDWKPATQAGKGVNVQIKVPVEFTLEKRPVK